MVLVSIVILAVLMYYLFIHRDSRNSHNGSLKVKVCPNCTAPIEERFNVCPVCKETLRRKCIQCSEFLDISWNYCPFCETKQIRSDPDKNKPQSKL